MKDSVNFYDKSTSNSKLILIDDLINNILDPNNPG